MSLIEKKFLDFAPFGTAKNKWFTGRNEIPMMQGQLTLNGKAIGAWSDDANGGVTRLDIDDAGHRALLLEKLRTSGYAFVEALQTQDRADNQFLLREFAMQLSIQCTEESEYKRITKGNVLAYELVPLDGADELPQIRVVNALYTEANVADLSARLSKEGKNFFFLNTVLGLPFATKAEEEEFTDNSFKKLAKKRIIVKYRKVDGTVGYDQFASTCSPANIKALEKRYGDSLMEILNLRWR